MSPLDKIVLEANLNTKRVGSGIVIFEDVTSTNDIAANYAGQPEKDGLVIFAENQTAGRGRGGNRWQSKKNKGLWFSILLVGCPLNSNILSIASAVAVAQAIDKCGKSHAKIKWPNDIYVSDKKIAGILIESKKHGPVLSKIIGVGVNCHQKTEDFDKQFRKNATSFDIEAGRTCNRNDLAKRLLTSFDKWLEKAAIDEQLCIDTWKSLSRQLGQRIKLTYDGSPYSGYCLGIDPQNGLIVQLDHGGVRMFEAALTSIIH